MIASTSQVLRLRRALVRMLWIAVADDETCACCIGDRCTLCYALNSLGLGRWTDADDVGRRLPASRRLP